MRSLSVPHRHRQDGVPVQRRRAPALAGQLPARGRPVHGKCHHAQTLQQVRAGPPGTRRTLWWTVLSFWPCLPNTFERRAESRAWPAGPLPRWSGCRDVWVLRTWFLRNCLKRMPPPPRPRRTRVSVNARTSSVDQRLVGRAARLYHHSPLRSFCIVYQHMCELCAF